MNVDPGAPLDRWEGRDVEHWRRRAGLPRLLVLDQVDSTSDVARALAMDGAPHGTAVLAEYQRAGRGRRGRAWSSGHGESLLVSFVLRPADAASGDAATVVHPALPLRVGLAAALACEKAAGVAVRLKWPNDLLIDDAKVAGILCEAAHGGPYGGFVVAGIGVNVLQRDDAWPPDLDYPATSLAARAPAAPSRAALFEALAERLRAVRPEVPPSATEMDEIRARDVLRDRDVRLDGGSVGRAIGVQPDGALTVRTAAGPITVRSGSVRIVNPGTSP